MKAKTLQIHWHEKQPVFSCDFEQVSPFRLATSGGDGNIMIWKFVKEDEALPKIEFLSCLSRHEGAVNVVRFSPKGGILASAGDDGDILLWKPVEGHGSSSFGSSLTDDDYSENWRAYQMLRGAKSDVYDLAWSPDGRYILTGSIDNLARVWEIATGKTVCTLKEHSHFVQGVAWDPLEKYIATQSCDRAVYVYSYSICSKTGKFQYQLINRISKLEPLLNLPKDAPSKDKDDTTTTSNTPKSFRLFHDENVTSFFRRLSFSVDGAFLITPCGLHFPVGPLTSRKMEPSTSVTNSTVAVSNDGSGAIHTVYGWSRNQLKGKSPTFHLPHFRRPAIVIKFSPIKLALTMSIPLNSSISDEGKKSQCHVSSRFLLPYRLIYAVGSQDGVLIYDTERSHPIAFVSNMHYATLNDLAWSHDGSLLLVASTDGYCSIIHFDSNELGTPYVETNDEKENRKFTDPMALSNLIIPEIDIPSTFREIQSDSTTKETVRRDLKHSSDSSLQKESHQKKKRIVPTFLRPL